MTGEVYLPFTVNSKTRKKSFTQAMEITSVIILFEAKRKKGHLFKSPEEVAFIAQGYYPILAYPWRERYLLFDGEASFHHNINVEEKIQLDGFIEEIELASGNRAHYLKGLTSYKRLIRQRQGSRQVKIKSLIPDKILLESLLRLKQTSATTPPTPAFKLPPSIQPVTVQDEASKVVELCNDVVRDIEQLTYTFDLLEERLNFFQEKIDREIDWLTKSYTSTLKWMTSKFEDRVAELDKKLKKTLEKGAADCKQSLAKLQREREQLRAKYRRLKLTERTLTVRRRRAVDREDRSMNRQLSRDLRRCQKELFTVKQQITQITEKENELESNRFSLKRRLKASYQDEVEKERKRINEVEAERDLEISKRLKDKAEVKERTSKVISHLKNLLDIRRLQQSEIESLAHPWNTANLTVIQVPFYIACYKAQGRLRYEILPPCIVQPSTGITKTLKKTFTGLGARVNTLLQPASKPLQAMLSDRLVTFIGHNMTLVQLINREGETLDLRSANKFTENLSEGLEALKDERWLSDKEIEKIASLS